MSNFRFHVAVLALSACSPTIEPLESGLPAGPLEAFYRGGAVTGPAAPEPPPPAADMRIAVPDLHDPPPPRDLAPPARDLLPPPCPAPIVGTELPPSTSTSCAVKVRWGDSCELRCPPDGGDPSTAGRIWPMFTYARFLVWSGSGNAPRRVGWLSTNECTASDGSYGPQYRFYAVTPAVPQPTPCSGEECLRPGVEQGVETYSCPLSGFHNWSARDVYYTLR